MNVNPGSVSNSLGSFGQVTKTQEDSKEKRNEVKDLKMVYVMNVTYICLLSLPLYYFVLLGFVSFFLDN